MASYPVRNLEELRAILDLADTYNPLIAMMGEFEARTGLRYVDVAKLNFSDVMINGVVKSSFTVVQSKAYNARTKRKKNPMSHKSAMEASKITIHVNDELQVLIRKIYLTNGHNKVMFQSNHHFAKPGNAISVQYINRIYKKIALELKLPYQLSTHSMRKTFAMLLLDAKASTSVIRDALGHSSIAVTDLYLRTFSDEAKTFTTGISF